MGVALDQNADGSFDLFDSAVQFMDFMLDFEGLRS